MIIFFKDLDELHQFTLSLDFHRNKTPCDSCSQHDQFVSHGFVYKKRYQGDRRIVGKRIICSNRYGRNGCGSTRRLYLAKEIPTLQYTTEHLFRFVLELIAYASIQKAYQKATGTENPRHAYRWLNKLACKLMDYRAVIKKRWHDHATPFKSRPQRCQVLLPTLQHLFATLGHPPCSQYQIRRQIGFI